MKHIYLVRHGQTLANTLQRHQSSDETLTSKGRLQAHHVAQILSLLKIDSLLCSTFKRARETAEIISSHLHLPYVVDESLVEIRRPDFIYGQSYYSFQTILYLFALFRKSELPLWDYAGAENMFALRNRIEDAKKSLISAEGERVVAVSHGVFMNLFLANVCRERKMTLIEFIKVIVTTKKIPNTGIVHLQFDEHAPKGVCAWQLVETLEPEVEHF